MIWIRVGRRENIWITKVRNVQICRLIQVASKMSPRSVQWRYSKVTISNCEYQGRSILLRSPRIKNNYLQASLAECKGFVNERIVSPNPSRQNRVLNAFIHELLLLSTLTATKFQKGILNHLYSLDVISTTGNLSSINENICWLRRRSSTALP